MKNFTKKLTQLITVTTLMFVSMELQPLFAQTGVRIAGTAGTADNSAMLDVISSTKGVLIPRMLESERTAISSPATGLIVYQTNNSKGIYYFDGAVWVQLAAGALSGSGANDFLARWSGGGLTTGATRDNGTNVGIGTAPTSNKLEVAGTANVTSNLSVGGTATVTGATALNGGLSTQGVASTSYGTNAQILANTANVNGGGIMVSDDGGFFDYNNGPVTFNGSSGLVIGGSSGASTAGGGYLRVNQLAGTNSRPVSADANGTLKIAAKSVGYVEDRPQKTVDGTNNGYQVRSAATSALTVESGDVVAINLSCKFAFTGGSGGDDVRWGVRVSGCGTTDLLDSFYDENFDNDRGEYQGVNRQYIYTATCAGTITVTMLCDPNTNADDASKIGDVVIVATRY